MRRIAHIGLLLLCVALGAAWALAGATDAILRPTIAADPGAGVPLPSRNPVRALDRTGVLPPGHAIPPVPGRKPRLVNSSGIPPSPERNPRRQSAPPVPKVWSPAEIAAAKAECQKALSGVALEWSPSPPLREGACGAPYPVAVKAAGKSRVAIDPPAILTCRMAASLARWLDEVVQVQAKAELKSQVAAIGNGTSYACRGRNGSPSGKLSEHAFMNALDMPSFRLADGRVIAVEAGWGPRIVDIEADLARRRAERAAAAAAEAKAAEELKKKAASGTAEATEAPAPEPVKTVEPLPELPAQQRGRLRLRLPEFAPRTPEARFLQRIHAGACPYFGTVLGPEANEAHRDHIHVDQAKRKGESFCE